MENIINTTIDEDALSRREEYKEFDEVSLYRLIQRLELDIKNIQREISEIKSDFENYKREVDENDPAVLEAVKSNRVFLKIKEDQLEELQGDLIIVKELLEEKMGSVDSKSIIQ